MRPFFMAAAIATLMSGPILAQKPRSIASPGPAGPTAAKALYRTLTVTYPAIGQGKMTLSTPAGAFTCTPPGAFAVGLPVFTCTARVRFLPLVLEAAWLAQDTPYAQTGNGKSITGQQWGGACAGTTGATCTLDMSSDRLVTINPFLENAAP